MCIALMHNPASPKTSININHMLPYKSLKRGRASKKDPKTKGFQNMKGNILEIISDISPSSILVWQFIYMIMVLEGLLRRLAARPRTRICRRRQAEAQHAAVISSVALKKDRVAAREDRTLNPKITGTLWACFLSSVVSGLPLCPAVFRLGLMSVLWVGSVTAVPS